MIKKEWFWIGLLMLLALGLRVYRLDYLELFGDEVDAGYQSYSLMVTGRDYKGNMLPTYMNSFAESRAPGLMYAMIPFIRLFGLNEWGVRLTPVFFGLGLILAFWMLLKILEADKKVRIFSTLLLAIIPWQIQYSRTAFELTLMSFCIVLGMYFWIRYLKNNKFKHLLAAGALYSYAIYTYNTANVYVPILVLVTSIIFKVKFKKIANLFLVGFILCLPIVYGVVFGSVANRFKLFSVWGSKEVTATVDGLRIETGNKLSVVFYNKILESAKRIIFNYTNAFSSDFLFKSGDVTFRHSMHYVGNIYWIMLPLILFGLIIFIKSNKYKEIDKLMLFWLLVGPIPASLTVDGYNHASRLFLLSIPLVYWAARGMSKLNRKVLVVALIGLSFELVNYQFYYWNNYRQESWRWWHVGYKELMTSVKNLEGNYDSIIIDNTYEPALIRYLFWTKTNPELVWNTNTESNLKVNNYFDGFQLWNRNVFFVNFNGKFGYDTMQNNALYAISQERDVGGDWDWRKDPPKGIRVLKTILNYDNFPIFYLVEKYEIK